MGPFIIFIFYAAVNEITCIYVERSETATTKMTKETRAKWNGAWIDQRKKKAKSVLRSSRHHTFCNWNFSRDVILPFLLCDVHASSAETNIPKQIDRPSTHTYITHNTYFQMPILRTMIRCVDACNSVIPIRSGHSKAIPERILFLTYDIL